MTYREDFGANLFWYGVFGVSGIVALIYEVSWQRLIGIYYGSDNITATIVISIFLFGLGLGAQVGGVIADRSRSPFALYALCELAIGVLGVASLYLIPRIGEATAGLGVSAVFSIVSVVLVVPTMLMGMTLPLFVEGYSRKVQSFRRVLPSLYTVNLFGAATGAFLTVYVLISLLGLIGALSVAATLNLLLAGLVLFSCRSATAIHSETNELTIAVRPTQNVLNSLQLVATAFIVGFVSLSLQISWYRVLVNLTKASPYAFATTLCVFLLALACGSYWSYRSLRHRRPVFDESTTMTFAAVTALIPIILIAGSGAIPIFEKMLTASVVTEVHPTVSYKQTWSLPLKVWKTADVFFWAGFVIFVPTLLLGKVLPLVIVKWQELGHARGQSVGVIYLVNILGNISGALVTGFVLFKWFGFVKTIEIICLVLVGYTVLSSIRSFDWIKLTSLALLAVAIVLYPNRYEIQHILLEGPARSKSRESTLVAVKEGHIAVATIIRVRNTDSLEPDSYVLYIDGLPQSARTTGDSFGRWLSRDVLAALARSSSPERVLVLGFGLGVFVHVLLSDERVKELTIVEIAPEVIALGRDIPGIRKDLDDRRVNLVIDDARRFLRRSDEKWDLIITDAVRSTTSMSGRLYSEEFYRLVADHLAEDGLFMGFNNWSQVAINTTHRVFEEVIPLMGFSFSSDRALPIDYARIQQPINKLVKNDEAKRVLIEHLRETEMHSIKENQTTVFNTDLFPRDEFSLWLPLFDSNVE